MYRLKTLDRVWLCSAESTSWIFASIQMLFYSIDFGGEMYEMRTQTNKQKYGISSYLSKTPIIRFSLDIRFCRFCWLSFFLLLIINRFVFNTEIIRKQIKSSGFGTRHSVCESSQNHFLNTADISHRITKSNRSIAKPNKQERNIF